jgi:hypothetical protein
VAKAKELGLASVAVGDWVWDRASGEWSPPPTPAAGAETGAAGAEAATVTLVLA